MGEHAHGLGYDDRPAHASDAGLDAPTWRDAQTLETLYYEDDLCAKIIDLPDRRRDAPGWTPELPGSDSEAQDVKARAERISKRARELKADERVIEAARWGRLYGGGAVLVALGPESGDPALPPTKNAQPRILRADRV